MHLLLFHYSLIYKLFILNVIIYNHFKQLRIHYCLLSLTNKDIILYDENENFINIIASKIVKKIEV